MEALCFPVSNLPYPLFVVLNCKCILIEEITKNFHSISCNWLPGCRAFFELVRLQAPTEVSLMPHCPV